MDSMKRFVEERKKTVQAETAKLHVEYDNIIAYLNAVVQKADANCNELLNESDYNQFRKKCVPTLNWLQEKYDNFVLMRSLCLPSSESDFSLLEPAGCQNITRSKTELPPAAVADVRDDSSVYESVLSGSSSVATPRPVSPQSFKTMQNSRNPTPVVPNEADCTSGVGSTNDSTLSRPSLTVDVMKACAAIPKFRITDLTLKVMVTWTISPWLFWVQVKQRDNCDLEDLLEELTTYQRKVKREDTNFTLDSKPVVGQLVSAQFTQDDSWYRACVFAVFEIHGRSDWPGRKSIEVDVVYVDYGNSERLPISRVRPLPEKFLKLPFQAFVCSLPQVAPYESRGTTCWPDSVLANFGQLDNSHVFTAHLSKPVAGCPIVFLDLLSTPNSTKNVKQSLLSEALITTGRAVRMADNSHVAKWYKEGYSDLGERPSLGEKLLSTLKQIDIHSTLMPIIDARLFAGEVSDMEKPRETAQNRPSGNTIHSQGLDKGRDSSGKQTIVASTAKRGDRGEDGMKRQVTEHANVDLERPSLRTSVPLQTKNLPAVAEHQSKKDRVDSSCSREMSGESREAKSTNLGSSSGSAFMPVRSPKMTVSHPTAMVRASSRASSGSQVPSVVEPKFMSSPNSGASNSLLSADHPLSDGKKQEKEYTEQFRRNENARTIKGSEETVPRLKSGGSGKIPSLLDGLEKERLGLVPSLLDGLEKGRHGLDHLQTSPCSFQVQKLRATQAYVEGLAQSGWPEKIAQESQRKSGSDYLNPYQGSDSRGSLANLELGSELRDDEYQNSVLVPVAPSDRPDQLPQICDDLQSASSCYEDVGEELLQRGDRSFDRVEEKKELTKHAEVSKANPVFGVEALSGEQNGGAGRRDKLIGGRGASRRQSVQDEVVSATGVSLIVPTGGFIRAVMTYVESPSRFWMHLVNDEAWKIDYIEEELTRCYPSATPSADVFETLVVDRIIHDFNLCCARSNVDDKVYRVELVEGLLELPSDNHDDSEVKVEVFFIDFGSTEMIGVSRLLPLPSHLVSFPPLAICCCLDGVEPVSVDQSLESGWPQKATDAFMELCGFTKALMCYFPADVKAGDTYYPSKDQPLRLTLVDPDANIPIEINKQLTARGWAREQAVKVDKKKELESGMDTWNPMAEDYLSQRNSYLVDVDDPGVAAVNYKAQDERKICRFYNTHNSWCRRGNDCPFDHISYGGVVTTTDRREVFGVCDSELQLELPPLDSWVVVSVTCMIDPSHFFVILPFGSRSVPDVLSSVKKSVSGSLDEGYDDRIPSPMSKLHDSLEFLMESLQVSYKAKAFNDNDLIVFAEGEIVVVRSTQDEYWYRAKVIISDPDNNRVKVVFVDFGQTSWVSNNRVRQIEKEFLYLPFQAVECRLLLHASNPSGKIWSEASKKDFLELTKGQYLVAHVIQREPKGLLYVDLYSAGNEEIRINTYLVERGHARPANNKVQIPQTLSDRSPGRGVANAGRNVVLLRPE